MPYNLMGWVAKWEGGLGCIEPPQNLPCAIESNGMGRKVGGGLGCLEPSQNPPCAIESNGMGCKVGGRAWLS